MNQYQRLIDNLTKLNLHNMAASIADYRQQVNDSQISFSEALLELTDNEITYQQQESLRLASLSSNGLMTLTTSFNLQLTAHCQSVLIMSHEIHQSVKIN